MSPENESLYRGRFTQKYNRLFYDAFRISRDHPAQGAFWLRTLLRQRRLANRRRRLESDQLMIPPVLILSVTNRCNLHCKGCYASKRLDLVDQEVPISRISSLFREAGELGIGVIMIAGGEPLMRQEILEAAGKQSQIIFPVFTNGMLLDGDRSTFFKNHHNMIPVLSIEGNRQFTDTRRGTGVYSLLEKRMAQLRESRQMFGMSITLTRDNFEEVTHPVLMHEKHAMGCTLFFLVEYVPQSHADLNRCLTGTQKGLLQSRLEQLRAQVPALFLSLPGDEERYGGCLAAGRGFIHISADGNLEPCPFAPYSDINIRDVSLAEALQSSFMNRIRQSHQMLTETQGGGTLWENR
ncbi:MAG: radical SAM protein, partial [Bacteroidales bacterium]|nr:radical SAM protein [Bacteroidales bacterium]